MAKKKFYAVKEPTGNTHIYNSWAECERAVKGRANVKFKGFANKEDAINWLNPDLFQAAASKDNEVKIYVDGSFTEGNSYAGWGWVAVKNERIIAENNGKTSEPALSRNIDGELFATIDAVEWAIKNKITATIVHDYVGIAAWAEGEWQTKSEIAKKYVREIQAHLGKFSFEKIDGHTGNKWNEYADKLAKKGLE